MNDRTQIDLTLNAYWKNYQNNVSIDMLYESQLRQCNLNESIDSLKELDGFLSNVRRDVQDKLVKAGRTLSAEQRKGLLLKDARFCRLVQFIGFYTGKVLSRVWKSQLICLDSAALQAMNPHYLSTDEFEHSLVIIFADIHKRRHLQNTKVNTVREPWLFFVLEPIFMRLFGGFDYQVVSIQGKPTVADGLYRAVLERLPEGIVEQINQKQRQKQQQELQAISDGYQLEQAQLEQPNQTSPLDLQQPNKHSIPAQPNSNSIKSIDAVGTLPLTNSDVVTGSMTTSTTAIANTFNNTQDSLALTNTDIHNEIRQQSRVSQSAVNLAQDELSNLSVNHLAPANHQKTDHQQTHLPKAIPPQTNPVVTAPVAISQEVTKKSNTSILAEQTSQSQKSSSYQNKSAEEQVSAAILEDLYNFQIAQGESEQQYKQVSQIMRKFDTYAEKQREESGILSSEIEFDPIQIKNRVNALKVMKSIADAGNTTAILHLSAYLLSGQWVKQNIEQAVKLIQQAANAQDSRAMRALSRLYYQGIGVNQDNNMGKYWVQEAASLGHPEAQQIVNQFNLAQSMLAERANEDKSDKMYLYIIAAIVVISLCIILLF